MQLGAYTACLHDRSLPETLEILRELGLTSAEINTACASGVPSCTTATCLARALSASIAILNSLSTPMASACPRRIEPNGWHWKSLQ